MKLKEFPTQEEYDINPEYLWRCDRQLEEEQEKMMKIINKLGDTNNLDTLRILMLDIGMKQGVMKETLLDWSSKRLQYEKVELLDRIIMFHDVIVYGIDLLEKRERGQ